MERFYIIAPAVIPIAYMLLMFAWFCARTAMGKQPDVDGVDRRKHSGIIGPFATAYFLWLIRPIERAFVASGVSPNVITAVSMLLCASSGVAAAAGNLYVTLWTYVGAGMLDVLDGRLARATNRSSKAGAFLDSVSDRWGELFVFTGFAWYLRDTPWLIVVMLAVGSSLMVSYTRARGEGLGVSLDGGTMQRAERILLVSMGTLVAAWFSASGDSAMYAKDIIGSALTVTGVLSTITSIGRWVTGYKLLKKRDANVPVAKQETSTVVLTSEPAKRHEMTAASSKHAA